MVFVRVLLFVVVESLSLTNEEQGDGRAAAVPTGADASVRGRYGAVPAVVPRTGGLMW